MPRLAIAQLRPKKGDYAANLEKIGGVLAQLATLEPAVDLVIFPETATSGYFVEGGVRDVAVTAGTLFRDLTLAHEAAKAPPLDLAVGFYEVFQNRYYNSCLYASLGNALSGNASPGNASPGNASPGNVSLQLVHHIQHPLQLFHRVVAVRGEADGALAQRADDMGPLERVVGLDGMCGSEADDRRAVRLGAR